jgi:hypothetical protein
LANRACSIDRGKSRILPNCSGLVRKKRRTKVACATLFARPNFGAQRTS